MARFTNGILSLLIACTAFVSFLSQPSQADDKVLGRGITAYTNGQLEEAHQILSKLIEKKSGDPRAFYFRGLVLLKSGRPEQADADFKAGADIEANETRRFFPVNQSLRFVQGDVRNKIEAHRKRALAEQRAKRQRVLELRYATGDAPALPSPDSIADPDVSSVSDATLPSFTLPALNLDTIQIVNLKDLPITNGAPGVLTAASKKIKVDVASVAVQGAGAGGGASGAGATTDPFATGGATGGGASGGTKTDPFATGSGGSSDKGTGSSDPPKSNKKDPFAN